MHTRNEYCQSSTPIVWLMQVYEYCSCVTGATTPWLEWPNLHWNNSGLIVQSYLPSLLRLENECTEAAIPDLWNVWGESARRTHHCFPEFLLSWTSEFLTMQLHRIPVLLFFLVCWISSFPVFVEFPLIWISSFVEFPLLLNFQFSSFTELPAFSVSKKRIDMCYAAGQVLYM